MQYYTASGALVELEKPAILKLHYDGALINQSSAPEGLGIYRWNPNSEMWQAVPGGLDEEQRAVVASVRTTELRTCDLTVCRLWREVK